MERVYPWMNFVVSHFNHFGDHGDCFQCGFPFLVIFKQCFHGFSTFDECFVCSAAGQLSNDDFEQVCAKVEVRNGDKEACCTCCGDQGPRD